MKKCAFCDAPAVLRGGEHIWSAWMTRLIPRGHKLSVRERSQQGIIRTYDRKILDLRLPVVCQSCNNGWMSELENDIAKPAMCDLIEGNNPKEITVEMQSAIAIFAFKSLIIADHMNRHAPPSFSRELRHRFRMSLQIPTRTHMWLAPFHGVKLWNGVFRSRYHDGIVGGIPGWSWHVLTYGFGEMVFQVVSWSNSKHPHLRHVPLPVTVTEDSKFSAVQFWPTDGKSIPWPRYPGLGDHLLKDFCERWVTFRSIDRTDVVG